MSQPLPSQPIPSGWTMLMLYNNRTFSPTTTTTPDPSPHFVPYASDPDMGFNLGSNKWNNETLLHSESGGNSNKQNETMELPIDMQFSDGHLLSIIVYSILMVISAIGNLSVLNSMIKIRIKARLNRVNLLLMHLAIADLFVTFLMMPLEIGWNITVSWKAGDFMCRFMSFFRTFGLFLSGFIVVCISFDRYFAVLRPLALPEANKRGRLMLYLAWGGSILCSLPQSFIFHLEHHPQFTWYEQCITVNSFSSPEAELAYNFFGFTFMYGIPMAVIIFCYVSILYEIYKVNALRRNGEELRRSSMEALTRAKVRTLKMTLLITLSFFLCWTPYNVMSLWHWVDKESAQHVDHRIQKGLFLFACTSSALNPLIYGLFHIRSHQRNRKSEMRIRQTLLANNCRLERIDRPLYGVRVRWKPRDCLCPATSGSSSDNSKLPQGHIAMINRGQNHHTRHQGQHYDNQRRRGTRSTGVDTFYGSQRQTKGTLIPLTSREFSRHIPTNPNQEQIMNGVAATVTSKQNGAGVVIVNNNNHMHPSSPPTNTTSFVVVDGGRGPGRNGTRNKSNRLNLGQDHSPPGPVTQSCSANSLTGAGGRGGHESPTGTTTAKVTQGGHNLSNSLQFDLDLELDGEVETGGRI